jgi:hypothetical protein
MLNSLFVLSLVIFPNQLLAHAAAEPESLLPTTSIDSDITLGKGQTPPS